MILGLGNDLVDIRRIARTLERHGARFRDRLFTAGEQARCDARAEPAAAYAKCFAAKEACAKALGTGFRDGVFWRDMAVSNAPGGRPLLGLTGGAAQHLAGLVPPEHESVVHLALSDEPPYAAAVVILEARPLGAVIAGPAGAAVP